MTGDQWFEVARWLVFFAFWVIGLGILIALAGVVIGLLTPARAFEADDANLGKKILGWLNIAFKQLMDPAVAPQQKLIALGMVLFMAGLALLVIAIVPALVGLAETALGGGGKTPTPTPTPTPSA